MSKDAYTYKTIKGTSQEVLFKDRGSKFYGYAFAVTSEDDIKASLETLKKLHHTARHFCYAYYLGTSYDTFRANDDGEPSNSAGAPILGQLQAFDVTNCLVVVVRYFGGTKLGVGGLIQAYKQSARMALETSRIIEIPFETNYLLTFDYAEMNNVMRLIKQESLRIINQESLEKCKLTIAVPDSNASRIVPKLEAMHKIALKKLV